MNDIGDYKLDYGNTLSISYQRTMQCFQPYPDEIDKLKLQY